MKRLFIILGLAYAAGRIIGAHVERRELQRAARKRVCSHAYPHPRIAYSMPFYTDRNTSQEVPHVR